MFFDSAKYLIMNILHYSLMRYKKFFQKNSAKLLRSSAKTSIFAIAKAKVLCRTNLKWCVSSVG